MVLSEFAATSAAADNGNPKEKLLQELQQQRIQACNSYRTLTHWVNKVKPLGEERPHQIKLEQQRVTIMNEWCQQRQRQQQGEEEWPSSSSDTHHTTRPVLLNYESLTKYQKRLVTG